MNSLKLAGRWLYLTLSKTFFLLYEVYNLNMTLKIHIILTHYKFYFEKMGKNFKETNGEFGETLHSTINKKVEAKKKLEHQKKKL